MSPIPDPVPADTEVPRATEVAVIGGGIIGVCASLKLAEQGIPVTLLEKGEIAAEQSSRNWGWCRQQGRDPREMPLIIESLNLWREMSARIGRDVGFNECGVLALAQSDTDLEKHRDWSSLGQEYGVESKLLRGTEVAQHIPGCATVWTGGLYTPSDGRAEPTLAAPTIALAARSLGAKIFTNTAVRAIDIQAGRVNGVVTEHGRIRCNTVIVAAGAWTSPFLRNLGIRLPQLKVRSSAFRTHPLPGGPEVSIYASGFAVRKRADGGYTIALGGRTRIPYDITPDSFRYVRDFLSLAWMSRKSLRLRLSGRFLTEQRYASRWDHQQPTMFEEERILNPAPVVKLLQQAQRNIATAIPSFENLSVAERWAGMIDVTPDAIPVISEAVGLPGCVIATGFSGHGFGIGPAAGEFAAHLALGQQPVVDPAPFRLQRFSDGSPITPIAGI
ncbi:MAG: D-amino-acid oxidase [Myxococcales bacterium]|nr:D-amino-acid oxidase [Myxococcales bacterium]